MLTLKLRFYGKRSFPITVNGCAVYCAAVRRWPSRQAWHSPGKGGRFNAGGQRAAMTGIRKGHPCGAAMYTSLTCLVDGAQKRSGSSSIANE